jgi:hypothetical protein
MFKRAVRLLLLSMLISLAPAGGASDIPAKIMRRTRAFLESCGRLLIKKSAFESMTLTAPLWPTEKLDEQMTLNSETDLLALLDRPFVYGQRHGRIYSQGYPLTELLAIGPVLFHTLDDFSKTQKAIIQQVAHEAKNPILLKKARENYLSSDRPSPSLDHGIEVGIWFVTLRDRTSFRLPVLTSYHPYEIENVDTQLQDALNEKSISTTQILKKEFFHWHPAIRSLAASLSRQDVLMVKNMLLKDRLEARDGPTPEVHIFSVSETPWGLLMGHYSGR